MKNSSWYAAVVVSLLVFPLAASSTGDNKHNPTWWAKYQYLAKHGATSGGASGGSVNVGANVDVSNECGPQSETYMALNSARPGTVAGGANEIFRRRMGGYFSSDGGASWGGVDLPLPPPLQGTNDTRFGSDPSLAFDTTGNLFYSYIVVFFGNGSGVDGTEMAVARSPNGGQTYPQTTFFSFETGGSLFNDKPMITNNTNPSSPRRHAVDLAWDAAPGGTTPRGIPAGHSTAQGKNFIIHPGIIP